MNVFLQDARWEEPAKTEACFAGFNNDGFCHKKPTGKKSRPLSNVKRSQLKNILMFGQNS